MKIRLYQELEYTFQKLSELCERLRQRFAVCADCGENRYTGKPCVSQIKEKQKEETARENEMRDYRSIIKDKDWHI